ncbi:hypothetical protein HUJ05_000755 [Dendroctonus ponderosae]|nr:hypothetical protein HUJ05_000755 [Dendroctonus ponderosae]
MTSIKTQNSRKKIQVSMVICEADEKKHRSGVNALQFDPQLDRLYSAGRDSIIRVHEHEKFIHGMEHHTDWVNDIVLCCGGRHYRELVASAGFDKSIYLWDINTLTALTASNNTVTTSSLMGSKESIYSLAMNPPGSLVVSGSTEKALRLWDPRSCVKLCKLKGSSDGSIKIWNIGQQRCIQTILLHTEAVWALLATENFTYLISGGRDKKVIMTDLKNVQNSVLVCTEEAPVLKMCFTADQQGIWVSTSDSTVRCWKLPSEKHFSDDIPLSRQPISVIPGDASTVKATILNDKRHILTKDSNGNVFLYDVLRAIKVESLGPVNYQNEINVRNSGKLLYVPNWFTTDLKTGMLTIHLGQDEVDCFAAWVSAKDAGIDHPEPDHKVNYGKLLLHALFEHYRGLQPDQESRLHFTVPKYIPLILSEIGGRTLYRVLVGDTPGETETALLNETVPTWVISNIEDNCTTKFTKNHVASNIISKDTTKKWKCKTAGEQSASVVLQLDQPYIINGIDIGNENSGYVEVLVSRASTPEDFKVLLVMSSFMSPLDARQTQNVNKVRMFKNQDLSIREATSLAQNGSPVPKEKLSHKLQITPNPQSNKARHLTDDAGEETGTPKKGKERNRNELLYSKDEEDKHEKIDKLIEKRDKERAESKKREKEMAEKTKNTPAKPKETKNNDKKKPHTPRKDVSTEKQAKVNEKRPESEKRDSLKRKHDSPPAHKLKKLKQQPVGKPCAFANTPKFNQVRGIGKIVKKKWLDDCYNERKKLPWRRYALDKADKGPESEEEICEKQDTSSSEAEQPDAIHALEDSLAKKIKQHVAAYNGILIEDLVSSIDIIVTNKENCKVLKDILPSATCVAPDWIWECHNRQMLVPMKDFIFQ